MKLLIVEDNAGVRQMLAGVLAGIATETHECADGGEAMAAYEAHRPDVVLMDIAMPNVNGILATRQIRAFDPAARVIIVTSYDEADLRKAAAAAGAVGYVLKENLLDLRRLLQRPAENEHH
ncbi:MAG: response regulator transcription factor [Blastocatellia bacterium]